MTDSPEASSFDDDDEIVPAEEMDGLQTTPPDPKDIERAVSTVPLEDEDGNEYVIAQQNLGVEGSIGGGEFPDADTPPRGPAPGAQHDG